MARQQVIYNLHTHTYTNRHGILEIVNRYPYQEIDVPYFSTGIHPWYIDEEKLEEHFAIIEQRLQLPNCLALGECGLDKRIETPLNIQLNIFEKQLALAIKYNKPVILHCVAAYDEVIAVKKKLKVGVPMIIHGFSKNAQVAMQLLDNGFYLSLGKYLLRNPELSGVLAQVPADRFFLETDTMEESIEQVYEKAAQARNISMEELQQTVAQNFKTVFKNG